MKTYIHTQTYMNLLSTIIQNYKIDCKVCMERQRIEISHTTLKKKLEGSHYPSARLTIETMSYCATCEA